MDANPQNLQPLDIAWTQRLKALTRGTKVDLNARLSPDNE